MKFQHEMNGWTKNVRDFYVSTKVTYTITTQLVFQISHMANKVAETRCIRVEECLAGNVG